MQRAKWLARQVFRTWSGALSVAEKHQCIVNAIKYATFPFGDGEVKFDLLGSNRDKLVFKWRLGQAAYTIIVEADLIAGLRTTVDLRLKSPDALRSAMLEWLHHDDPDLPDAAERLTKLMDPAIGSD